MTEPRPAADLRGRIAEALEECRAMIPTGQADAVMAVLPAPADRAAVLREAADRLERLGLRDLATQELRRMAAEAETGGAQ